MLITIGKQMCKFIAFVEMQATVITYVNTQSMRAQSIDVPINSNVIQ